MKQIPTFTTELITLAQAFQSAGAVLYAVGGLPRNALLNVPPSDMDVCSVFTPEETAKLCEAHGYYCFQKAPQFGTSEIHVNGAHFEHTTFRGDTYGAGGTHRPACVRFSTSLTDDAFRRDFTCNALYINILTGDLSDPTGGEKDMQKRRIRTTSRDPAAILRDDSLRILRMVRFACELGFTIEKETWKAACAHVAGLADIAWERKREELMKILMSDTRYPTLTGEEVSPVLKGLTMLYELGAFPYLIPELLEGEGVAQRARFHAYDVFAHNIHACAASAKKPEVRVAALLHDIGKPAALREKGLPLDAGAGMRTTPDGTRIKSPMLGHDLLGVPIAREVLTRLRFPNEFVDDVLFLIEHHMFDLNNEAKEGTLRARFASYGYRRSQLLCDIREADMQGSGHDLLFIALRWREVLERMKHEGAPFSLEEVRCTGEDIMRWRNIQAGKEVGEIKRMLLKHCARRPQDNRPEKLAKVVKNMALRRIGENEPT